MEPIKFSKNRKLNAVLTAIYEDLNYYLGEAETARYKSDFPHEMDFNIAQYGNLLVYYDDVRELYKNCGYTSLRNYSNQKIWEIYKRQVGYIARHYFPPRPSEVK